MFLEKTLLTSVERKNRTRIIAPQQWSHLPEPVQRWLHHSGISTKKTTSAVKLLQKGQIRLARGSKKWMSIKAEEIISVVVPSFTWKSRIKILPGIYFKGEDKLQNGKGEMTVKLQSILKIVHETGPKIDEGSLQRYLGEICWIPEAAIKEYTAQATISQNEINASVIFHFNESGQMMGCTADRFMKNDFNAQREKWEVRMTEFALFNGIEVPSKCEITWKLKDGDFKWAKIEIMEIKQVGGI